MNHPSLGQSFRLLMVRRISESTKLALFNCLLVTASMISHYVKKLKSPQTTSSFFVSGPQSRQKFKKREEQRK